jgi:hypothetical protein
MVAGQHLPSFQVWAERYNTRFAGRCRLLSSVADPV